jgi:hypothetical protein
VGLTQRPSRRLEVLAVRRAWRRRNRSRVHEGEAVGGLVDAEMLSVPGLARGWVCDGFGMR